MTSVMEVRSDNVHPYSPYQFLYKAIGCKTETIFSFFNATTIQFTLPRPMVSMLHLAITSDVSPPPPRPRQTWWRWTASRWRPRRPRRPAPAPPACRAAEPPPAPPTWALRTPLPLPLLLTPAQAPAAGTAFVRR